VKNITAEHEQHGLVALILELGVNTCLPSATRLKPDMIATYCLPPARRHRRRIESDADVDLPERLHGGVVERHHGASVNAVNTTPPRRERAA